MYSFISLLRKSILGLDRYPAFLLIVWLVMLVSLPLLRRIFGLEIMLQGFVLAVLIQVLFVLNALYNAWGWWSMLRVVVGIVLLTWAAEAIGIRNGYLFGSSSYTDQLQPQVMGVPLLVPLLWLMMLPPAWVVARLIVRKVSGCLLRPVFILLSALAFTAWSFFLDPLMLVWNNRIWSSSGSYFGIPWINFLGHMIVSAIVTFAISPKRLPAGSLLLVYVLAWVVGFVLVLLFWGFSLTAFIGFFLMGGMLVLVAICPG